MSAQQGAQSVPQTFIAPDRPGDALAWGDVDSAGLLPIFTPDGLWCVIDTKDANCCYFIGGDDGPVKIGHSQYPQGRLMDMINHSPVPLKILAVTHGGRTQEVEYHIRFHRHRLHGEWFERTPEIQTEIDRLNAECPYVPFIEMRP
jgi:hypothetical protein